MSRRWLIRCLSLFFFFNDTATTEIYTLSLHDALPIFPGDPTVPELVEADHRAVDLERSEEHTSELQSRSDLVCRLLLEKKTQIHHAPPRGPYQHGLARHSLRGDSK